MRRADRRPSARRAPTSSGPVPSSKVRAFSTPSRQALVAVAATLLTTGSSIGNSRSALLPAKDSRMGVDKEERVPGTKRASSGVASSTASHFSTFARSSRQASLSTMLLTRATPSRSRSWPRSFDGFNGVAMAASAASLPCLAAGVVVAERAAVVARSGSRACILCAAAFCKSAHVPRVASGQVQRMQAAACLWAAVSTRPRVASARATSLGGCL